MQYHVDVGDSNRICPTFALARAMADTKNDTPTIRETLWCLLGPAPLWFCWLHIGSCHTQDEIQLDDWTAAHTAICKLDYLAIKLKEARHILFRVKKKDGMDRQAHQRHAWNEHTIAQMGCIFHTHTDWRGFQSPMIIFYPGTIFFFSSFFFFIPLNIHEFCDG